MRVASDIEVRILLMARSLQPTGERLIFRVDGEWILE